MATAKKLPSGNYRARVYDKSTGKTKSFTAPTKKEAEFLANEWLTGRQLKPLEEKTIKQAVTDYIQLKKDILSPTTTGKYRNILENQLSSDFLGKKLSEINSLAVQAEINRLCGSYSPKTVHNANGLIAAVLKTYFPDRRIIVTLPKIQKRQRELPTAEEIVEIFAGSGEMELIVMLAMWQGLRASEIRGLKKSDLTLHFSLFTKNGFTVSMKTPGRPIKIPRNTHSSATQHCYAVFMYFQQRLIFPEKAIFSKYLPRNRARIAMGNSLPLLPDIGRIPHSR